MSRRYISDISQMSWIYISDILEMSHKCLTDISNIMFLISFKDFLMPSGVLGELPLTRLQFVRQNAYLAQSFYKQRAPKMNLEALVITTDEIRHAMLCLLYMS